MESFSAPSEQPEEQQISVQETGQDSQEESERQKLDEATESVLRTLEQNSACTSYVESDGKYNAANKSDNIRSAFGGVVRMFLNNGGDLEKFQDLLYGMNFPYPQNVSMAVDLAVSNDPKVKEFFEARSK